MEASITLPALDLSKHVVTRKPSLVRGGPLRIDPGMPETLTAALARTAAAHPQKGIHLVNAAGTESFLSYPVLLENASGVAAGLRSHGCEPGTKVILQLDSLESHFAAFWGCLLHGMIPVTVAIAPTYQERNGVIDKLHNTWLLLGRPPIITVERLRDAVSGLTSLLSTQEFDVVCIEKLLASAPDPPSHKPNPLDVAFIQLSSGSTGVPKCIQETHRGIIAHVHSSAAFNGYSSSDVTLNWLPMDHVVPILTFHLKDTFLGCEQVHVATDLILGDPLMWLNLLEAHAVTHTWSPNFGFKLVADKLARGSAGKWNLSGVKAFMNAGEQVTMPVVRDFLRSVAPFGVAESAMQPAFGMAEVCTCMTYANGFSLETGARRFLKSSLDGILEPTLDSESEAVEFVGLGRAAPGVSIRIADAYNQVVPEGKIGRLQIHGPVVTPGYFNNPDANAEAFVGDDWFNSGDLGFIRDEELFLTGREKEMIIVRGAKFYCYEVEDMVNGLPGVELTYVAACGVSDAQTGTESLAIFFTPEGVTDELNLVQAIRRRVTARLGIAPAWVVPLAKDSFPKTTSGKNQRTQLRKSLEAGAFEPVLRRLREESQCGAGISRPETEIEGSVAAIWREVLGRPTIEPSAHLFDLGGDSLKATQIVSRVRSRWRLEFPTQLLFNGAGTIQGMAEWLEDHNGDSRAGNVPVIGGVSRPQDVPLSFSQLRIWLAEQVYPGTAAYNVCRILTLKGELNAAALEAALQEMVKRHEILRTTYRLEGLPAQEIAPRMPLSLPKHDLIYLPSDERRRIASNIIAIEAARAFSLDAGPPLRVKLIRMADQESLLVVIFHQIATDAWSLGIFSRELAELYAAFAEGNPAAPPKVSTQYADFAVWQRKVMTGDGIASQLEYWKKKLRGPLPSISFETVRNGSNSGVGEIDSEEEDAAEGVQSAVQTVVLSGPLLEKIRAFGARHGATLNMTLLAAFKLLLRHATGEEDILVGSPESGRHRLETETMLGCFVNTVVLRTRVSSDEPFETLLSRVRQTVLDAVAHADVPFENLTQAIPGDSHGGHRRFFQVWFGAIDSLQPFQMGGLVAQPRAVFPPSAQFDLSFFFAEQPETVVCFLEHKKLAIPTGAARRLLDEYREILSRAVGDAQQPRRERSAASAS